MAVLSIRIHSPAAGGLLDVDYRNLVSRADILYEKSVARSEEGLPIGNGRMGTLVWTTPAALKMQINRVDVFASGCGTNSFPERHTDYCGGCGFVDIEFPDYGDAVFPNEDTRQHLSCTEGLVTVEGRNVQLQAFAWHETDVIAVQISDQRDRPGTIHINLRMLRASLVRTAGHTAASKLDSRNGSIVLTQEFVEDNYFCGSAVAVGVAGRRSEARRANDGEFRLVVEPGRGSFTVFIASAAGFTRGEDFAASALAHLETAAPLGFAGLIESNRVWWKAFWEKSFVHLHSGDGIADRIQENYLYYLYVMASCSRGRYPAKFNGMLWNTGGDTRKWGAQYWGANQSCLYNNALFASGHAELMDPMFDMVSGMFAACSLAARQQWGSLGIFIPETLSFDGLAPLPDSIASEMQDLYLLRKPWDFRSMKFREFAGTKQPHSSRWNWLQSGKWVQGRWVYEERGSGPYGPVTHIFSRGAKTAYQYWLRYEYTRDANWLRERTYPILKGVAEFYRNYPNLKKGPDGKYHIHNVNSNEPLWGGQDTDEEISSMRGILPVVIRASEILKADALLRTLWMELLDNLAPLPRSDNPYARERSGPAVWIKGLDPVVHGRGGTLPDGNTLPVWFFDLCTLESDPAMLETANATFDAFFPNGYAGSRGIGVLSKLGLAASVLGRADAVKLLIPDQMQSREIPILANRMDLREGPQTNSVQRLGNAADALHTALCQDLPPGPGKPSVIRVFPAWPGDWDADFTLLCRGGFTVASSIRQGQIEFVEITPQTGGECRLRNPWDGGKVTVYRNGRKFGNADGPLLKFDARRQERITVVRAGTVPDRYRRSVPER